MPHESDPLLRAKRQPLSFHQRRFTVIVVVFIAVSFSVFFVGGRFRARKGHEASPQVPTPRNETQCQPCAMKPSPDKAVMPGLGIDLTDTYG